MLAAVLKLLCAIFLSIVCVLGADRAQASGAVVVGDGPLPRTDVAAQLSILVDEKADFAIEDVMSGPRAAAFEANTKKIPAFGFTRSAIWTRFTLDSHSDRARTVIVELATARLSHFTWYVVDKGRVEEFLPCGAADARRPSQALSRYPVLEVPLPAGESRTIYGRAASETSIWLPLSASSPLTYSRDDARRTFFELLLNGFCLAVAIVSLILGFAQQQKLYLRLAVYAAMYVVYYLVFNGYAGAIGWDLPFWCGRQGTGALAFLATFVFVGFNNAYIGAAQMNGFERAMHRCALALPLVCALSLSILPFGIFAQFVMPLQSMALLMSTVAVLSRCFRDRRLEHLPFILTLLFFVGSSVMMVLQFANAISTFVTPVRLQELITPSAMVGFFVTVAQFQRTRQAAELQRDIRRASEKQAFDLTENIPAGTYMLGLFPDAETGFRFDFQFVSTRFLELFGVSREAVKRDAMAVVEAIHPEDRLRMRDANLEALHTGQPFRWEGRLLVGGRLRWVLIASNPRSDANGATVWQGVVTDITARIDAERKLAETLKNEQRLREEAEVLRRQAEEAQAAKSLFLAKISHEIRTPLSALVSLSQAMWMRSEKQDLSPEFTEFLNRVRSGGQYLNLLLRNVLNVSAAESGRIPVRATEFYVADWAGEVLNILEPIADYHRSRIEWTLPEEDEARVCTDPMRLTQIALNLGENALKFSAESGHPVRIFMEKNEGGLHLVVEDRGPGIPADSIKEVFSEFEQAGAEVSALDEGVGLGLAVVKINAELLGGQVRAQKLQPHGMRFTVEIPDMPRHHA